MFTRMARLISCWASAYTTQTWHLRQSSQTTEHAGHSRLFKLSHHNCARIENIPPSPLPPKIYIHPLLQIPTPHNLPTYHQSPCAFIASATLLKPAILLPATKLGNSPSLGSTYFFAVSSPFVKHASMIPLSLPSTSSAVQDMRWEFCAISSPETATPPALAALPNFWDCVSISVPPKLGWRRGRG